MEDSRWLRLVTIGLVLAALAVGYFLLSGKLSPTTTTRTESFPTPSPSPTSRLTPTPMPTSTPKSAYSTIVNRTQAGVQVLPRTGFPVGLMIVFSISAVIFGWGLRKFPH